MRGQILTGFCFLCVKLTALKKLTLSQRPEHLFENFKDRGFSLDFANLGAGCLGVKDAVDLGTSPPSHAVIET